MSLNEGDIHTLQAPEAAETMQGYKLIEELWPDQPARAVVTSTYV